MKTTGIAVLGYGGIGEYHVKNILSTEGCRLTGVYDILPARNLAAEAAGLKAFSSYDAMLADPDTAIVIIAIPNDQHETEAVKAMRAGKHIICEKPAAPTSAELVRMLSEAEKQGVLFTVHQNRRWDEDFLIVKRLFDEGTIGSVFSIESRVHGSRGIPGDWRKLKAHGGGMVLDWGVHLLDQMVYMLGRGIESVQARLSYINGGECDDGFKVNIRYACGLNMLVEVGTTNFINMPRWYVLGTSGAALITDWELNGHMSRVIDRTRDDAIPVAMGMGVSKTMAPRTGETVEEVALPKPQDNGDPFLVNVLKAVQGEDKLKVTGDEALFVLRLMEVIFKAAEEDRIIKGQELAGLLR